MYIDKLDDIVNEYNKTYHRTIKLNHIELKDNLYIYIYIYICYIIMALHRHIVN